MNDSAELGRRLETFFAARADVLVAYLFGSHAEGRAHRESDVDVAVLLDRTVYPESKDRFEARVALSSDLVGLLHQNEVDVVVLNDAPPLLARRIGHEGRQVHCADAEAEHAFRRNV